MSDDDNDDDDDDDDDDVDVAANLEEEEEEEQEAELAKHDMPKAGGKQALHQIGPAGTAVDCRQDVS
ncbi:hypothetical protein AWZ03_006038 [Drosophila navojoa]|uniref:Uncharacterized protein n=1 Tax=Drosophila navojoa TaxID=7232 RepID=A0A484BFT0_DRONA|nr:hypothetical protein AWZ03_006038 [Drosophila navojoa]